MSDGWSFDRYLKSVHDDDAEDCDCIDCCERARDDYYGDLRDE